MKDETVESAMKEFEERRSRMTPEELQADDIRVIEEFRRLVEAKNQDAKE